MKEARAMADLNEGLGLKKTYDEDKSVEKESTLLVFDLVESGLGEAEAPGEVVGLAMVGFAGTLDDLAQGFEHADIV